jgi:hypothetical protein
VDAPTGETPPFYRIAELHFPSIEALQKAASSQSAQEAIAESVAYPQKERLFLVAEEARPLI